MIISSFIIDCEAAVISDTSGITRPRHCNAGIVSSPVIRTVVPAREPDTFAVWSMSRIVAGPEEEMPNWGVGSNRKRASDRSGRRIGSTNQHPIRMAMGTTRSTSHGTACRAGHLVSVYHCVQTEPYYWRTRQLLPHSLQYRTRQKWNSNIIWNSGMTVLGKGKDRKETGWVCEIYFNITIYRPCWAVPALSCPEFGPAL